MRRFAYTPVIEAYILASDSGKLLDVSNDIVSGGVTRNVDAISSAELTLQNRRNKYTGLFKPMDKIIMFQGRVSKMLTFSGYLDSATYYQIYPDVIKIEASCPLKMLQNLYFDPALPDVVSFFEKYGWTWNPKDGVLYAQGGLIFGDLDQNKGLGEVIRALLVDFCKWDSEQVIIQGLPDNFAAAFAQFYETIKEEETERFKDMQKLLIKLLGTEEQQAAAGVGSDILNLTSSLLDGVAVTAADINAYLEAKGSPMAGAGQEIIDAAIAHNIDPRFIIAIAAAETTFGKAYGEDPSKWGTPPYKGFGPYNAFGYGVRLHPPPAFSSFGDAVDSVAGTIAGYLNQGITTFSEISGMYVNGDPNNPASGWTQTVTAVYNELVAATEPLTAAAGRALQTTAAPAPNSATGTTAGMSQNSSGGRGNPIAIAQSQIGVTETSANWGPQVQQYLAVAGWSSPAAWCAAFIAWVLDQSGYSDKIPDNSAGVINWYNRYPETSAPQVGNLVIRDAGEHIGMITSITSTGFTYISGNSGAGSNSVVERTITFAQARAEGYTFHSIPGLDPDAAGPLPPNSPAVGGGLAGTGGPAQGPGGVGAQEEAMAMQAGFLGTQFKTNEATTAFLLTGKRGLANDIPVFEWIKQACQASGRSFMSLPDGSLYFFYPDPFGLFGMVNEANRPNPAQVGQTPARASQPYWVITPIETLDLNVQLSDKELATHVFATFPHYSVITGDMNEWARAMPMVASVQEEALKLFLRLDQSGVSFPAETFINRYGVRPISLELPYIRHPFLAWFACWNEFLKKWYQQYYCNATFTYMPELYPGGRVEFRGNNRKSLMVMYVEQVSHSFDRGSGFRTQATLSAPMSPGGNPLDPYALVPGGLNKINQMPGAPGLLLNPTTEGVDEE